MERDMTEGSREALVAELMWNLGGTSFGICSMANSAVWEMDSPGPNKPDLPSIVASQQKGFNDALR